MIRKATQNDLSEIVSIDQMTLTSHWTEKQYLSELSIENGLMYVIEVENYICGFFSLRILDDTCDLLQIAVHQDFQSRGYGNMLMNHLCKAAINYEIKNIFLEVEENNRKALQFYLKYNFEEISIRKNYYGINRNAVVMRKVL